MRRTKAVQFTRPAVVFLSLVAACDSGAPRGPGTLLVEASSTIQEPQFFQFGVAIDSGTPRMLFVGQSETFATTGLAAGRHSVTTTGLPSSCAGGHRRDVDLRGDDTVLVTIAIQCGRMTGDIKVNVATTGVDLDPDGYVVMVDQTPRGSVPANGSVTALFLAPGPHLVSLADVASNCTASGGQTVTVDAGAIATADFAVTCTQVGTIRLVTSASGTDRDPDGLTLRIDTGAVIRGDPSGTMEIKVSVGTHSYVIGDVEPNCTLADAASGSVTIANGEVVTINAALSCSEIGLGTPATVAADPANDTLPKPTANTPPANDVLSVTARFAPNWLILVMHFARSPVSSASGAPGAMYGYLDLDVDENSGTGARPIINSFGGAVSQGVEYTIVFFDSDSVSTSLYRHSTQTIAGQVRTKYEGDSVVVQIPLNKIADDGNVTITAVIGTSDRPTDLVPNSGVVVVHALAASVVAQHPALAAQAPSGVARRQLGKWGKWR